MDNIEFDPAWETITETSKKKLTAMAEAGEKVKDLEMHFERPVLGKILVLNRRSMPKFKYEKPWACISITDITKTAVSYPHNVVNVCESNRTDL